MNTALHHIAKNTVQPPKGERFVLYESGMTTDIIKSIIQTAQDSYQQTADFAQKFNCGCANKEKTLLKIFDYVKTNIKYKIDASGTQLIKTPSAIIHSGFGDCKAYSILIGSILKNLNIPFVFRFVSYAPENQDVTHVYIVAFVNNQSFVLDACLPAFNQEKKPYYHKKDLTMTKIIKISGVGSSVITPFEIDPYMNEGELTLLLTREQLELEREIARRKGISGIGEIQDYDNAIYIINEAINRLSQGYDITPNVAGIGFLKNLFKKKEGGTAVGNFLRKVGNAVKEGAKAVVKVVTLPVRLAVKGILELKLPKASPYFLPIFATDEQAVKLPASFQNERARAKRRARFITDTVGMKEDHFMKIIRNGIMKQKGQTPETLINAMLTSGIKVSGIGNAETQQGTSEGITTIGLIMSIIEEIVKLFGKKAPDDVIENGEAMVFETSLETQPIVDENTGLTNENYAPQSTDSSTSGGMMIPLIGVALLLMFGRKRK